MENYEEVIAAALDRLYVSERGRYVCMAGKRAYVPKQGKRPVPLTLEVLLAHVRRQCAVGVYADETGSRFMCFDVDDGRRDTVEEILSCLYACGVPEGKVHVSLSGGKGYHIELFFDEEIPAARLKSMYEYVLAQCGLDERKVEFRPTSGMAIKLPLSVHWRTGAVCWFVDRHTLEPIETADYILGVEPWHACDFQEVLRRCVPVAADDPIAGSSSAEGEAEAKEYVARANAFAPLKRAGTRHRAMVRIATSCRYRGMTREECTIVLKQWYRTQPSAYINSPQQEVMRDLDHIVEWAYGERFERLHKGGDDAEIHISCDEMLHALAQHGKASRKIYFAICVGEKANCSVVSQAKLAESLHLHHNTVRDALVKMAEAGEIEIAPGDWTKTEDGFYRFPNAYYTKPKEGTAAIKDVRPKKSWAPVALKDLRGDLTAAFYGALDELFDLYTLVSLLSKTEFLEYLRYRQKKEEGEKGDGNGQWDMEAKLEADHSDAATGRTGAGADCGPGAGGCDMAAPEIPGSHTETAQ